MAEKKETEFDKKLKVWLATGNRKWLVDTYKTMIDQLMETSSIDVKAFWGFLNAPNKDGMTYFDDPASTRYHNAELGGLAQHGYSVMQCLREINNGLPEKFQLSEDTVVICGLFHDICKNGIYHPNINQNGTISKTPFETIDPNPLGHGEKSVIILQEYIDLTDIQKALIRWHMGPFDRMYSSYERQLQSAFPNHLLLYFADHIATMVEGGISED